jgi:outer membrane protein assembly factor BamB
MAMLGLAACSGDKDTDGDRKGNGKDGAGGKSGSSADDGGARPPGRSMRDGGPLISRIKDAGTPAPPERMDVEGECGTNCFEQLAGPEGAAFDPDKNPSDSVGLDPDGALVIVRVPSDKAEYIWISNTPEHTVSKINVETYVEEARYLLDTGVMSPDGVNRYGTDPSRTSVNGEGDAFVGSRNGHGLTRISSLGADCPDTNGDGMITTSTGPLDVLAYRQDDCVLWFTELEGTIRGVAAQDIPSVTMIVPQLDGQPKVTSTPEEHFVWVGNTESQLWKIDASTGKIVFETPAPTKVYGLAMNGSGTLYTTAGYLGANIGLVDTSKCVDVASCAAVACAGSCVPGNCPGPDTCKDATKTILDLGTPGDGNAYGITVDCKQRVWLAALNKPQPIRRFDPSLPDAQRLALAGAASSETHGIGADRSGFVWGAQPGTGGGLVRINAETLETLKVPLTAPAKGIGIDRFGKVWGIAQATMTQVVQPGATIADNPVVGMVQGLVDPYTYSDMTGEQLRLASNAAPGTYRQLLEGVCPDGHTDDGWQEFKWDVETPTDTWVVFNIRTADTIKSLEAADYIPLAGAPSMVDSTSIAEALAREGIDSGKYLEIAVELYGAVGSEGRCGSTPDITPRVKAFTASFTCTPPEPPPPPDDPPPPPPPIE